jgi:hypothetical protein
MVGMWGPYSFQTKGARPVSSSELFDAIRRQPTKVDERQAQGASWRSDGSGASSRVDDVHLRRDACCRTTLSTGTLFVDPHQSGEQLQGKARGLGVLRQPEVGPAARPALQDRDDLADQVERLCAEHRVERSERVNEKASAALGAVVAELNSREQAASHGPATLAHPVQPRLRARRPPEDNAPSWAEAATGHRPRGRPRGSRARHLAHRLQAELSSDPQGSSSAIRRKRWRPPLLERWRRRRSGAHAIERTRKPKNVGPNRTSPDLNTGG